jgi:FAD/FMN-containing dehydrogenase
LFPRPQTEATACVAVRDPAAAVALLAHLRASCGDRISAFEIISRSSLDLVFKHMPDTSEPFATRHEWVVITQLADVLSAPLDEVLREALRSFGEGIIESGISADKNYAERWWKLRKNISEAQKREGISIKHDVSVPVSRVAEFIARADAELQQAFPGIRIVAFGHMGDGNIHYNISMQDAKRNPAFIAEQEAAVNRLVYETVGELNGSISAEHGVGQLKRDIIRDYKDSVEMELMRTVKQALDPRGLMNPGKVL